MAGVADQHDRVAVGREPLGLDVDLGHERAGGVDRVELAHAGVRVDARGHAVGGEHHRGALGHVGLGLDEHRAALAQLLDHELVVDDLLADVHGRAVQLERALDRLHGPVDARAVTARRREQELLGRRPHRRECRAGVRADTLDRSLPLAGDDPHDATTPRPPQLDRRLVPPSGGAGLAHAHRRRADLPGARHRSSPSSSTTSAAGCTSCRATGRSWPRRRSRPAGRCGSTIPTSTSSTTSATPRCRRPGTEEQLFLLASRIASQQLDRDKPLWENWLVEGLEGDRFALISKTHHALVDGVSGVDLATVLFDLEPNPPAPAGRTSSRGSPTGSRPRSSSSPPASAGCSASPPDHGARTVSAATRPVSSLGKLRDCRRGRRRDRLGRAQPGARDAAERRDRPPPAVRGRPPPARRLQEGQEHVRRHGQRRRADRRLRRARALAASHAGSGPRGSRCARSCRCRSAPTRTGARSATSSR